jgi:hypothetical protein
MDRVGEPFQANVGSDHVGRSTRLANLDAQNGSETGSMAIEGFSCRSSP